MMNPNPIQIIRKLSREIKPDPSSCDPVLPGLPGIKAVIFDVYGTLFTSSRDLLPDGPRAENLLRSILHDHGIRPPDGKTALTTRFHDLIRREHATDSGRGIPFPEVEIRDLWSELLDHPPDALLEDIALRYECGMNPVWPMPGAAELLTTLRARGLSLGIVSNAQFYTPWLFPALLGRELPDLGFTSHLCLFSYQHGVAKPGAALYRILRERLEQQGLTPGEALYLGNDALKDIHPAAELGFRTALFAGDNHSLRLHRDRIGLHPPTAILTNLNQVPELLKPS